MLVLAAVLLVAGCGGKSTNSPTSTADWTGSVCSALTAWKTSIRSTLDSLRAETISITSLQSASDEVKSANQTLADALKNAGEPNTRAGRKTNEALDKLLTQITTEQDRIDTAVNEAWSSIPLPTAIPTATPVVLGSFKALESAAPTTFEQLPSAFNRARACHALKTSS
jgi:hypothetical protein